MDAAVINSEGGAVGCKSHEVPVHVVCVTLVWRLLAAPAGTAWTRCGGASMQLAGAMNELRDM